MHVTYQLRYYSSARSYPLGCGFDDDHLLVHAKCPCSFYCTHAQLAEKHTSVMPMEIIMAKPC